MTPPADNAAARAPPERALVDSFAAIVADIEATITYWQNRGITAEDIAVQLQCGGRWTDIRRQMISIAIGSRRITLARSDIVQLVDTRRRREVTQAHIAERLGVSRITLHDYERGNTRPTEAMLAAWRLALAATSRIGA